MQILNKSEMKKVMGGHLPPDTTTCSCTLKSSTGVTLTLPSSITNTWTTSSNCSSNCSTYCAGANQAGGDCASDNWLFTTAS